MIKKSKVFISLFLTIIIFFIAVFINYNNKYNIVQAFSMKNKKDIDIVAVGNILVHYDQIVAAYNSENDKYEFDENFRYIKKYIEEADLAYCTIEGSYGGKQLGYSGYPRFNSPESMLEALKNTGFDIINASNDNILTCLKDGYFNTIDNLEKNKLKYIGIKKDINSNGYVIEKINGIKVGFTSYTLDNKFSKNSNVDLNLINSYNYDDLDNSLLKIKSEIEDMIDNGAKFIIVGMHWGDEFTTKPNDVQKYIANELNSYGVDVILGSHPNVVQPIETIVNEENEKSTLVVYSMGNFISNQRQETIGNRLCEDSIILKLKLEKTFGGDIKLKSYDYIDTWTLRYKDSQGNNDYYILDSNAVLNYENKDEIPDNILKSLKKSIQSNKNIINNK